MVLFESEVLSWNFGTPPNFGTPSIRSFLVNYAVKYRLEYGVLRKPVRSHGQLAYDLRYKKRGFRFLRKRPTPILEDGWLAVSYIARLLRIVSRKN